MAEDEIEKGDLVRWVPFGVTFVVDKVSAGPPRVLFAKGGTQSIWAKDCVIEAKKGPVVIDGAAGLREKDREITGFKVEDPPHLFSKKTADQVLDEALDLRPLKDVVEVLEEAVPGKHVSVMHGDERVKGVPNRWSWSCRCGSGSKRADLTISEVTKDFEQHVREAS